MGIDFYFCRKSIIMELIPHREYIEKMASLINRGMMLILVGQRLVGKSKMYGLGADGIAFIERMIKPM